MCITKCTPFGFAWEGTKHHIKVNSHRKCFQMPFYTRLISEQTDLILLNIWIHTDSETLERLCFLTLQVNFFPPCVFSKSVISTDSHLNLLHRSHLAFSVNSQSECEIIDMITLEVLTLILYPRVIKKVAGQQIWLLRHYKLYISVIIQLGPALPGTRPCDPPEPAPPSPPAERPLHGKWRAVGKPPLPTQRTTTLHQWRCDLQVTKSKHCIENKWIYIKGSC